MARPTPTFEIESARRYIGERSFYGSTGTSVGVELEWFTTPSDDPRPIAELEAHLADVDLPCGSRLSFEPGAQVELSSAALPGWRSAIDAVATDTESVRARLAANGIDMFANGIDADRAHALRTDSPRYVAMREYFDRYGPSGGRMMCATASIHLNVDAGDDAEGHARWRAAHALGPTLVAAFANSPVTETGPTGDKSSRWCTWRDIDPTRTSPPDLDHEPAEAWARYALDANVMFVRASDRYHPCEPGFTMRAWIEDGHELGYPDTDDLDYHLTTLFPPVRARGWLEIRMLDMLPDPWWQVAVAVATTAVCDPVARRDALAAVAGTEDTWDTAARCGAEDPALLRATTGCFHAVLGTLDPDDPMTDHVRAYNDRFIKAGRCPADDQLTGSLIDHAEAR